MQRYTLRYQYAVLSSLVTALVLVLLMTRGGIADEKGKKGKEEDGGDKGKTAKVDPDEKYVKDKLKDFLHPSDLEFLDNGRVKMVFEFREKDPEHETIFTVPVRGGLKDAFRWTIEDEEIVIGGDEGLRVSNRGAAFLKVWFQDDLEAEMQYLQYVNHAPRHVAALVFSNSKRKGIGSNFGSQCALFSGGRRVQARGKAQAVVFDSTARIKLVVKDGVFEAHRNGRLKQKLKYPEKSFSSGRIGFVWGGSLSGIIPRLEVAGKLDYKQTAAEMRKKKGSRRRR